MARTPESRGPRAEREIEAVRSAYTQAFNRIVAERLSIRGGKSDISRIQKAGFIPILSDEIFLHESQITLPFHVNAVVEDAFKGFPRDPNTGKLALRVKEINLYPDRTAIDVAPTILTPQREGLEAEFITYPDGSRAVFNSLRFFIASGDYIVGLGNPNCPSTWVLSTRFPPRPYNGERHQLTAPVIKDLTSLISIVGARKHSNLKIHRIH